MPVRGGRVQKRVNEGGQHFNFDGRNINLGLSMRQQYGLFAAVGLDPPPSLEELDELEALLEREQELLGQHQISPASINLLHSPDQSLRPPIESIHRRGPTPRTIPRTYGCNSVPLNQLSSIILNMTFSDAEEDHQGSRDGRERTSSGGNEGGNSDRERSTSRSRTESGVSNASTVSLASPPSAPPPPPPPVNGEVDGPSTSGGASNSVAATGSSAVASSLTNEELANKLMDMKGVDSKKIMEKLQQIQGYIQQTTTAMAALELQGDLASQSDIYTRFVTLKKSLQHQEGEYMDILARSLVLNKAAAQVAINGTQSLQQQNEVSDTSPPPINGVEEPTPANSESTGGNQIVGIVRASNVQGLSLQERLVASQVESSAIMTRMRDSIARREDLMTRYKATRERLENLKKQRQDMRQEQRALQESNSASDPLYEDPVPGAETWSSEDIANSIIEFQALFEKVVRIQDMYAVKAQTIDPDDEEAQAQVASKIEQVTGKRRQLIDALTKLRHIQRQRESEEQIDAGDAPPDSQPGSGTAGATNSAVTLAESDDSRNTGREQQPAASDNALVVGLGSQPGVNAGENIEALGATLTRVNRISEDVSIKQNELASLQKQFNDMKKLLDATTAARIEDEKRMIASKKRLEEAEALVAESRRVTEASNELRRGELTEVSNELRRGELTEVSNELSRGGSVEGAIGEEIISVSGRRVQLSESERQNPTIIARYQDLAKAKERLAKMEDVMSMISSAKKNRQDLREVLPPEYLTLLEDAENEYPDVNRTRRQLTAADVSIIEEESEDDLRASRRYQRSSRSSSQ